MRFIRSWCLVKHLVGIMGAVCLSASVPGCLDSYGPGSQDFSYKVSGGYQVWHGSANDMKVIPIKPQFSDKPPIPSIPSFVEEIAWDKSFILTKQYENPAKQPE